MFYFIPMCALFYLLQKTNYYSSGNFSNITFLSHSALSTSPVLFVNFFYFSSIMFFFFLEMWIMNLLLHLVAFQLRSFSAFIVIISTIDHRGPAHLKDAWLGNDVLSKAFVVKWMPPKYFSRLTFVTRLTHLILRY